MMQDIIKLVENIGFLGSALGVVTFSLLYAFRSSWYVTQAGKALFGFVATIAAIFILIVIRSFSSTFAGWDAVLAVGYLALAISIWYFVIVLVKAQSKKREPTNGS